MARIPNVREQQVKCDRWNRDVAVGAPVRLRRDDGRVVDTATRSEAQLLGGHTAVVWLKDVSGCYSLNRVTPL